MHCLCLKTFALIESFCYIELHYKHLLLNCDLCHIIKKTLYLKCVCLFYVVYINLKMLKCIDKKFCLKAIMYLNFLVDHTLTMISFCKKIFLGSISKGSSRRKLTHHKNHQPSIKRTLHKKSMT